MATFRYVYILVSETNPKRHYTGSTHDLDDRSRAHNAGQVPHTSRYRSWRIETAIAFCNRQMARGVEDYLKIHSGRAFASKHF